MDIDLIRQSMLKQAAANTNANTSSIDHSKLHRDQDAIPGGPTAFVRASGGASDNYNNEAWNAFAAQHKNWKAIGANPFSYTVDKQPGTNEPVISWDFRTATPDGNAASYKTKTWPNQLAGTRVGAWLMNPSYQRQLADAREAGNGSDLSANNKQRGVALKRSWMLRPDARTTSEIVNAANAGNARFTVQPYTNEELMRVLTLDPSKRNYLTELLQHYRRIPEDAWRKGNLRLSSDEETKAWMNARSPLVTTEGGHGMYWSGNGKIGVSPAAVYDKYQDVWGNSMSNPGRLNSMLSQETYADNNLTKSPTMPGLIGDIYGHESGHMFSMGRSNFNGDSGALGGKYFSRFFNPKKPVSSDNVAALFRPLDWRPLLFDKQQYDWLKNRAIQPYAVNEAEMNQALTGFNRGRWTLKRDIESNPDNPNYKYLREQYPGLLDKFMAQPDFIPADKAGREQLDNMMQFFIDNPQLKPLMPEQFRFVGYYQNLKAALDHADTPEEKQFFQNLMDSLIYSKAYLANNKQRSAPSYQDAYQQMTA